ncbi:unannotated protein [freshwater metagenome]|uniref:Unannotated protein n=1 Tax=freshwater metagenome TaxID=449393 RepID=A0A6J6J9U8_9ZZZZ
MYESAVSVVAGKNEPVTAPLRISLVIPNAFNVVTSEPTDPRIHCGAYRALAAAPSAAAVADVTPNIIATSTPAELSCVIQAGPDRGSACESDA